MSNQINYAEQYDVFLSYRRDGGETMAVLLRDRLAARGYRVFLDIESLNPGAFNEQLLGVIEHCTDFLLICSKGSLDRCKNNGDWVRREIAHALNNSKNVIPFMLRGFVWPKRLPDDITKLPMQNGVTADSNVYFDAAIDLLCKKFLMSKPYASATGNGSLTTVKNTPGIDVVPATNAQPKMTEQTPAPNPNPLGPLSTAEYITIKGKQYSTALTLLNLPFEGLRDEDIIPLQYMTDLTELLLFKNDISDLTPLSNLKKLSNLGLQSNRVSDLTPLSGLMSLKTLDLAGNPITDWSPVAHVPIVYGRPKDDEKQIEPVPMPVSPASVQNPNDNFFVRELGKLSGADDALVYILDRSSPHMAGFMQYVFSKSGTATHAGVIGRGPGSGMVKSQIASPSMKGAYTIKGDKIKLKLRRADESEGSETEEMCRVLDDGNLEFSGQVGEYLYCGTYEDGFFDPNDNFPTK